MRPKLAELIGQERNRELHEIAGRCMCCMIDDVEGATEVVGLMCHVIDRAAQAIVQASDFEQLWPILQAVRERAEDAQRGGDLLQ